MIVDRDARSADSGLLSFPCTPATIEATIVVASAAAIGRAVILVGAYGG